MQLVGLALTLLVGLWAPAHCQDQSGPQISKQGAWRTVTHSCVGHSHLVSLDADNWLMVNPAMMLGRGLIVRSSAGRLSWQQYANSRSWRANADSNEAKNEATYLEVLKEARQRLVQLESGATPEPLVEQLTSAAGEPRHFYSVRYPILRATGAKPEVLVAEGAQPVELMLGAGHTTSFYGTDFSIDDSVDSRAGFGCDRTFVVDRMLVCLSNGQLGSLYLWPHSIVSAHVRLMQRAIQAARDDSSLREASDTLEAPELGRQLWTLLGKVERQLDSLAGLMGGEAVLWTGKAHG